MLYILLGGIGFGIIHLFDFVSLKKLPVVKPFCWVIGCGILVYSTFMIDAEGTSLAIPAWLSVLGWAFFAISLALLIYSLFINLPFGKTYLEKGVGNKLITSGFYALVRHPGVMWFALLMLSLIPITKSSLMIPAAIIWTILDIILVVIQDKFIFGKMFSGYKEYQKKTPMLIPNIKSIRIFLNQCNNTKTNKAKEI